MTPAMRMPSIHLSDRNSPKTFSNRASSFISNSLRPEFRSSFVANSLRFTANTSESTAASASACSGGTPAALSLLANFRVSKAKVAMMYMSVQPPKLRELWVSRHGLASGCWTEGALGNLSEGWQD